MVHLEPRLKYLLTWFSQFGPVFYVFFKLPVCWAQDICFYIFIYLHTVLMSGTRLFKHLQIICLHALQKEKKGIILFIYIFSNLFIYIFRNCQHFKKHFIFLLSHVNIINVYSVTYLWPLTLLLQKRCQPRCGPYTRISQNALTGCFLPSGHLQIPNFTDKFA